MAETQTMPTKVEDFLENRTHQTKNTDVEKAIDIEIDAGNLLAFDTNEINLKQFRKKREDALLEFSRDSVQVLLNTLCKLPSEKSQDVTVTKLPEPTVRLPREKPVPKPKQATKWEAYAQLKGIQKKKKGRMLWDKEEQKYKPRWGYGRKDETKAWVLPVPENADPMEDQFEKVKKAKKERIAKNELQRLRNIARTTKTKVRGVGLPPTAKPSKDQLGRALAVTHKSTASLGNFMDKLPKEKIKGLGKKRKFEDNNQDDREGQRKILKRISDGMPVLDVKRAANVAQHMEERQRAASKKSGDGDKKRKAGTKGKKGGKKSFMGKGKKGGGGKGRKK